MAIRKEVCAWQSRGRWSCVLRSALIGLAAVVGLTGWQAVAQTTGSVEGTITDPAGALVPKAQVTLTPETVDGVPGMPIVLKTDDAGDFKFKEVPAGHFLLAVTATGFQAATAEDKLLPGQQKALPPIVLQVGIATTEVTVTMTQAELAEKDVKEEEQQKVFGIIPNFFVVYKEHPLPLDGKQKLELAFHGIIDPFPFASSAVVAGIQQAANSLPGYHQGVEGYAKRYGAAYTNFASATMLRDGLFPAVFHQDPRYYYRGTGTNKSRALYAFSTAVICKGDNGKNQFNIAGILGNFSAGALTNLYYPAGSRNGASTTIENGLLATVGVGAGHVLQEFLFKRITNRKAAVADKQP
jgi:hypothetical protein